MEQCDTKISVSSNLKFGIERILSNEFSSSRNNNKKSNLTINNSNSNYLTPCLCSQNCTKCKFVFQNFTSTKSLFNLVSSINYSSGLDKIQRIYRPSPVRPVSIVSISSIQNNSKTAESGSKRKRTWSRAVFSSLQRKGLERRFSLQKYITKPDRRQLAATLGLTDAQVKVWFQNRRMKWRHMKGNSQILLKPPDSIKDARNKEQEKDCTDDVSNHRLVTNSNIYLKEKTDVVDNNIENDDGEDYDDDYDDEEEEEEEDDKHFDNDDDDDDDDDDDKNDDNAEVDVV